MRQDDSGAAFQSLRHEGGKEAWAWHRGVLHPRLRGRVVACAGFEIRTAVEQNWREIPIPRVPLIISLDGAIAVEQAGESRTLTSFVCGPDDGPTMTGLGTRWAGLQVDLTPPAAAAVLRLPLAELSRAVVPLEDLLGPAAVHLEERLVALDAWPERISLVQAFLVERLAGARELPAELHEAWRLMVADGGRSEVRDLADHVGWSRQHLSTRFSEELGLSPKRLARVVRLDHAATLARAGGEGWSWIALECGYYDQAHMINEFRELAGCTPSEYVGGLATADRALTDREATFFQDSLA